MFLESAPLAARHLLLIRETCIMESTLTAKAEVSIVLLSLLESVVLGFYGYYIGEVAYATIPLLKII